MCYLSSITIRVVRLFSKEDKDVGADTATLGQAMACLTTSHSRCHTLRHQDLRIEFYHTRRVRFHLSQRCISLSWRRHCRTFIVVRASEP